MRRLLCILLLLTVRTSCFGQINCAVDLTSLLYTGLHIDVGYGFTEHWSFSISAGVSLKTLSSQGSNEEISYNSEFPQKGLPAPDPNLHRESFRFSYWPEKTFDRFFISMGVEYRDCSGVDACIGLGYFIPI